MRFADLDNRMEIWDETEELGGRIMNYTKDGGVLVAMPNDLQNELDVAANLTKYGFIVKPHPQAIGYVPVMEPIPDCLRHFGPKGEAAPHLLMYHFVPDE